MKITNTSSTAWGYLLAMIGSASYGLNPLFAMPLYNEGITPMSVLFYRYAISTILMGIYMLVKDNPSGSPKTRHWQQ